MGSTTNIPSGNDSCSVARIAAVDANWRWALFRSVTSTTTAIDAELPSNFAFEALTSTSTMLPSRARMVEASCTGALRLDRVAPAVYRATIGRSRLGEEVQGGPADDLLRLVPGQTREVAVAVSDRPVVPDDDHAGDVLFVTLRNFASSSRICCSARFCAPISTITPKDARWPPKVAAAL